MSKTLLCTAAGLLALAATAAHAQSVDFRAAMRDPTVKAAMSACLPDRERYCATVWVGGGRVVRCLAENAERLTPACRDGMQQARSALIEAGVVKSDPAGAQ